MRDFTDAELDSIDTTDGERADANRFVRVGPDGAGRFAVHIESTPDAFCVLGRYDGPRATENAEEHRQGVAAILADVFAMRRLGIRDPRAE